MTTVTKRDGTTEELNIDKIHKVLNWAVKDLEDVSVSDIEMGANLLFFDGIATSEIHNSLIKSASDLISKKLPDYQYVAARLLMYKIRKDIWGESEPPRFLEHIKKCVELDVYDKDILKKYTQSEIHKIGKIIDHCRDKKFTYAGLQQLVDKYLCKDRGGDKIYETPQFAYMMIAMTLFSNYPKNQRISYVKKAYNYFSLFKINLPTPIMCGVRTNKKQFASCSLFDVDDTIDSIFANVEAVGKYTANRAGIGLNIGRMRAIGSKIRGGEVVHTGIIPFLKVFESTVKSCQQAGVRGGCFQDGTKVLKLESIMIDGKEYQIDDEIGGILVSDIIQNNESVNYEMG